MEESRIHSTWKSWEERNHPLKESVAQKYVLKITMPVLKKLAIYKLSINSLTSIMVLMSDQAIYVGGKKAKK